MMQRTVKAPKKKLIAAVCVPVALALLTGALLLIFSGPTVYKYRSQRISRGVFCYLYSYYRYQIPASSYYKLQGVTDTPAFWAADYDEAETNGEHYGRLALRFIEETVVSARLFDSVTSVSSRKRAEIAELERQILDTYADGSKRRFNELAKKYGFDYGDFSDATLMLYKANSAKQALFGYGGAMIDDDTLRAEYLKSYIRVKMIFVRTKDMFVTDAHGNIIKNDDGSYMTRPLTPEETAKQNASIEAMRTALSDGADDTEFDGLYREYNDGEGVMRGYYLCDTALYTESFKVSFPSVADRAFSLGVGECAEVTSEYGTHFLLRTECDEGAYSAPDCAQFFSDFATDVAQNLFADAVAEERGKLTVTDREFTDSLDFGAFPPNKRLFVKFDV